MLSVFVDGFAIVAFSVVALLCWPAVALWAYVWHRRAAPVCVDVPPQGVDPRLLLSATALSAKLRAGAFTSESLVAAAVAHCRATAPHINAIVFDRYELAAAEARAADAVLDAARARRDFRGVGWLTGVPCTIKECFKVAGCPNAAGLPARAHIRSTEDAVQVALYREAGAIVLGVTNTSELCMWMESSNNVYGTTRNPYDSTRIVGGSSGGEAAAIAAGCAPFGLGSDIGGSIRMPAYFCGIFGHKPSTRLVPNQGQHPGCEFSGQRLLVTGPMARHAEDLYPLLQTLTARGLNGETLHAGDAACPAVRDPATVDMKQIRVYCIEDLRLPLSAASAEQRDACKAAAFALADEHGCAVRMVDFANPATVPRGWEAMPRALDMWGAMGSVGDDKSFNDHMSEGKAAPFRFTAEFLHWFRYGFDAKRARHSLPAIGLCGLEKLQCLLPKARTDACVAMAEALQAALNRELGATGVIVVPTYPTPTPRHGVPLRPPLMKWVYTALFNAMQTPVTAVPIWPEATPGQSPAQAPRTALGVQIVGAWGCDHVTIATALALERIFGGYKPPTWMQL
jgi:fatty acid amide hydrolase 2